MRSFLTGIKLMFAALQAGYYVAKSMWTERHHNYAAVYSLLRVDNQWEETLMDELLDRQVEERAALMNKFQAHRKAREEMQDAN